MSFLISFLGKNYTIDEFVQLKKSELPKWAVSSYKFLKAWQKGKEEFTQKTSGSTGKAKKIYIEKKHMIASAQNTIEALHIPRNAKALLCIDTQYIGGKMMLVRAILGDWHIHLIKPKGKLKEELLWNSYDFAAMVPLQVSNTLVLENGIDLLNRIDRVIIGGAATSESLTKSLHQAKSQFFSTFGMTETVSHIALKALNGKNRSEEFKVIGDNQISTNSSGCLMIKGAVTDGEWVETNDLIKVTQNGFQWIGRFDMVVNTGGVKVSIENTEESIAKLINSEGHHFILWKKPDEDLGEKLIGISDSKVLIKHLQVNKQMLIENLPKYHFPKEWYLVDEIKLTESGKVDRRKTSESTLEEISFE